MICYRPHDGDVASRPTTYRPRNCFLMTGLGPNNPPLLLNIIDELRGFLRLREIDLIDANTRVSGRDYLNNIWNLAYSVPIGIVVLHEEMSETTYANIFYELGIMQALGKETLVVRIPNAKIPSDLVRTQYVTYGPNFQHEINSFIDGVFEQANYYINLSRHLENDPLLSIDYLRRAYLICGDDEVRQEARTVFDNSGLQGRAKLSVEALLVNF